MIITPVVRNIETSSTIFRDAGRRRLRLLDDIRRAGTLRQKRKQVRAYLSSPCPRIYHLSQFIRKHALVRSEADLIRMIARARNLSPFQAYQHRTSTRTIQRGWEGRQGRQIVRFQWPANILQNTVKDAISASRQVSQHDWAVKGRGLNAACHFIQNNISGDQFSFALVADVQNCFGSVHINAPGIIRLLPTGVVRNVISSDGYPDLSPSSVSGMQLADRAAAGPRGLPQGSACSPIVLSHLFADLEGRLSQVRRPFQLVIYVDDILILTETERDAQSFEQALRDYLTNHRAGPFALKSASISSTREGFDFLQRRFTRGRPLELSERRCISLEHEHIHFVVEMRFGYGRGYSRLQSQRRTYAGMQNAQRVLDNAEALYDALFDWDEEEGNFGFLDCSMAEEAELIENERRHGGRDPFIEGDEID